MRGLLVRGLMGVPPMPQPPLVFRIQLDTASQEDTCLGRWPIELQDDGRAGPESAQHLSWRMSHQNERKTWRKTGNDILAVPITTQRHRAYTSVNHPCSLVRVQSKKATDLLVPCHASFMPKSRNPQCPICYGESATGEISGTGFLFKINDGLVR